MSTTNFQSNRNISRVEKNKKFCKVCKDAGKLESEYTSHFVRDFPGPSGKTVCPTLLGQQCRCCGETGHTYKYCQVVVQKEKETKFRERSRATQEKYQSDMLQQKAKNLEKEQRVKCGAFTSIMVSSSDEEDDEAMERRIRREKARARTAAQMPAPVKVKMARIAPADTYLSRLKKTQIEHSDVVVESSNDSLTLFARNKPAAAPVAPVAPVAAEQEQKQEDDEVVQIKRMSDEKREQMLEYHRKLKAQASKSSWDIESSDDEEEDDDEEVAPVEEETPAVEEAPKEQPIVVEQIALTNLVFLPRSAPVAPALPAAPALRVAPALPAAPALRVAPALQVAPALALPAAPALPKERAHAVPPPRAPVAPALKDSWDDDEFEGNSATIVIPVKTSTPALKTHVLKIVMKDAWSDDEA